MIHYTASGWYLAEFAGDITDSKAKGRALSLGDKLSERAGAKGTRGIHDPAFCGRAPGLTGCSYVCGNRPAYSEAESTSEAAQ